MPLGDPNKLNRIEELKTKLFSKNYQTKLEHRDSFSHLKAIDVSDSWEDPKKSGRNLANYQDKFFMRTSRFKKFFIFSLVFLMLTLGYAAYVFFFAGNTVSNDNIDISILGNTFTAGGEDLSLVVGITNRNNAPLDLVDLVVEYPKGGDSETNSGTERLRESLGTIPAGATRNENVKLVLFGQQGSIRNVKVSIEYRVQDSNAIFVKEKPYGVTINSTPLNITVDAPTTVSPNQDVVLNIKSTLNSTRPLSNILLRVDYPPGFSFASANPKPTIGNNIWSMGDLVPGVDRSISISGKMLDVFDGEEKSFHVSMGSQSASDKSSIGVVFNSFTHTMTVKKAFIEANIFVGGVYQKEYAVNSQTPIEGEIRWRNNLDTKIDDMVIRAQISGNAFDKKTVSGEQGIYDSLQSAITWDKFSQSEFAEVNPGDSGSVKFSIPSLALVSAAGILTDPSVTIEVSISGKQLIEGYQPQELNNSDTKVVKIISDAGLSAKALYYSGPFTNTGPIPPKVEKETTYTVTWSLSNTSNNISKAQVQATLPSWVRFVGPISPVSESIMYNSASRQMIWNAGRIPKGMGLPGGGTRSVSFQIGLTPLFSQVKGIPVIINEAVLTGHDDFANVDVKVTEASLRTQLTDDTAFPPTGGLVTE